MGDALGDARADALNAWQRDRWARYARFDAACVAGLLAAVALAGWLAGRFAGGYARAIVVGVGLLALAWRALWLAASVREWRVWRRRVEGQ
jgi:hypothetical protein